MSTESFVLMQPSTVIALKLLSAASFNALFIAWSSMSASVRMKASKVAMLGSIMPAPFAIPQTQISVPPTGPSRNCILGYWSVVMMARAASGIPSGESPLTRRLTLPATLSMGSFRPMTPVEATSTWDSSTWRAPAQNRAIFTAS